MPIATFYDIQRYYRYNMWDNKSVFYYTVTMHIIVLYLYKI